MAGLKTAVAELEKSLITKAMAETNGNVAKAARLLDMPVSSLWRKLERHCIHPNVFKCPHCGKDINV